MCSAISIVAGSLSRKFAIQVKTIISLEFSFDEVANQGFLVPVLKYFCKRRFLRMV
jgi:hypothetical protein